MGIETVVEQTQAFQLKVFSKHYRPSDEAEDGEAQHDDFVHQPAALKDLDEVGVGEERCGEERGKHE
jgi:hypothetical protein